MAIEVLSVSRVRELLKRGQVGKHGDGGGLVLAIKDSGTASWVFRYQRHGQRRDMGLGAAHAIGLADARALAREARRELAFGRDPLELRHQARRDAFDKRQYRVTFAEVAEQVLKQRALNGDSASTQRAWRSTLATYVLPVIGKMSVAAVGRADVLGIVESLWTTKHETASRLRWRIEAVIDSAIARGLRTDENPARLALLAPVLGTSRRATEHHAALPWREVPALMKALSEIASPSAMALAFTILNATRQVETLGALWPEIEGDVWTIPASRVKMRKVHRVPLSAPALMLLKRVHNIRRGALIFPSAKDGAPLSRQAMARVLDDLGQGEITVHGFRSSFRDWCRDHGHDRELAEAALAHGVRGVEGVYARSDVFDRRRKLMNQWAAFCCGTR